MKAIFAIIKVRMYGYLRTLGRDPHGNERFLTIYSEHGGITSNKKSSGLDRCDPLWRIDPGYDHGAAGDLVETAEPCDLNKKIRKYSRKIK